MNKQVVAGSLFLVSAFLMGFSVGVRHTVKKITKALEEKDMAKAAAVNVEAAKVTS